MLLRKMGVQDAAGDLGGERGIAREGEAHRLGESTGDATPPQLGDRRRGAGGAVGDSGRPGKLPDAVGAKTRQFFRHSLTVDVQAAVSVRHLN